MPSYYPIETNAGGDLSPEAPRFPVPHQDASGDVAPEAPSWDVPHQDAAGETEPKAPIVDGVMPMNIGRTTGSL